MKAEHLSRMAGSLADLICKRVGITHEVYFDVLFKALAPWERRYKSMLARVWDQERRIVLANLKKLKAWQDSSFDGCHNQETQRVLLRDAARKHKQIRPDDKLARILEPRTAG